MKILKKNLISSALIAERRLVGFSPEVQRPNEAPVETPATKSNIENKVKALKIAAGKATGPIKAKLDIKIGEIDTKK